MGRGRLTLTHAKASWALSEMTSPNWPVRWNPPLPGMLVDSMSTKNAGGGKVSSLLLPTPPRIETERKKAPLTQYPPIPTPLIRQPRTNPDQLLHIHLLGIIPLRPQHPLQVLQRDLLLIAPLLDIDLLLPLPIFVGVKGLIPRLGVLDGLGPTDGAELAFDGADAGFAGVGRDEVQEDGVGDGEEVGRQGVCAELFGEEVLARDVEFFVVLGGKGNGELGLGIGIGMGGGEGEEGTNDVAGEFDDFHAVVEGVGDGVERLRVRGLVGVGGRKREGKHERWPWR